ncbi:MAG: hypothetical protein QGI76_10345, partial [Dehalococcoidia bacterium]|nr:hypothetical protein [Dehalococcoidia bacterium]
PEDCLERRPVGYGLINVQANRATLLADKLDDEADEAAIHYYELHHQARLPVGGHWNPGGHHRGDHLRRLMASGHG